MIWVVCLHHCFGFHKDASFHFGRRKLPHQFDTTMHLLLIEAFLNFFCVGSVFDSDSVRYPLLSLCLNLQQLKRFPTYRYHHRIRHLRHFFICCHLRPRDSLCSKIAADHLQLIDLSTISSTTPQTQSSSRQVFSGNKASRCRSKCTRRGLTPLRCKGQRRKASTRRHVNARMAFSKKDVRALQQCK